MGPEGAEEAEAEDEAAGGHWSGRRKGPGEGPSRRLPLPGSPGGWTRASTARGVRRAPSSIRCLTPEDGPWTLRFPLPPPGRSVPAQRQQGVWAEEGVPGRGRAGTGRAPDRTARGSRAQGAAGAFINRPLSPRRECGRAFRLGPRLLCHWQNETWASAGAREAEGPELLSTRFENCQFRAASLA